MASTHTNRLRVELQADGENDGTWGQKANDSIERLDLAVAGYVSVAMSDANTTLSTANSGSGDDESSCFIVKLTGTLTAGRNIVVPSFSGRWLIWNTTSGGFDLTTKTSGGTGATCKNGYITPCFSDGTNVYPFGLPITTAGVVSVTDLTTTGDITVGDDLTVTDAASIGGALTVTGTASILGNATIGDAAGDSHTVNGLLTMASKPINEFKGADIASATTTDIGAATGNFIDVTGTTTITGLGTIQAGTKRKVRFTGILTLTHNATSLILPTAANITTVANDRAEFISLGSGNWLCFNYTRADGSSLAAKSSFSAHKNGTAQTGIAVGTETLLTFGTEVWDVGSYFATNKWTPPAGKVRLSGCAYFTGNVVDQSVYLAVIYKNGVALRYGPSFLASGTGTQGVFVDIIDDANGTDYYEMYVSGAGAGTKTVDGTASLTYFQGQVL